MNSKELVSAALAGLPTPRVPTGPLAVHFCASIVGYDLVEYSTSAKALADSVVRYYERFRPDAIWVSADTWVSAQAMGAKVGSTGKHQPLGGTGERLIRTAADIEKIPAPDVSRQGRYPLMLEALASVVAAVGRDVFVVGCFDQYPFSLATELMGIEQAMMKAVEDPSFVEAVMNRCGEYALAYGTALSQAGADMLSGGDSPAGLLGPKLYSTLALPAESRLINALKSRTGKPVSLHICGNTTSLMPLLAASGAAVLEIDHAVNLTCASKAAGKEVALWGNIDPVGTLLQAPTALVKERVRSALSAVKSAGHKRFVLSSGCTLAVDTPRENLEALLAAGC